MSYVAFWKKKLQLTSFKIERKTVFSASGTTKKFIKLPLSPFANSLNIILSGDSCARLVLL